MAKGITDSVVADLMDDSEKRALKGQMVVKLGETRPKALRAEEMVRWSINICSEPTKGEYRIISRPRWLAYQLVSKASPEQLEGMDSNLRAQLLDLSEPQGHRMAMALTPNQARAVMRLASGNKLLEKLGEVLVEQPTQTYPGLYAKIQGAREIIHSKGYGLEARDLEKVALRVVSGDTAAYRGGFDPFIDGMEQKFMRLLEMTHQHAWFDEKMHNNKMSLVDQTSELNMKQLFVKMKAEPYPLALVERAKDFATAAREMPFRTQPDVKMQMKPKGKTPQQQAEALSEAAKGFAQRVANMEALYKPYQHLAQAKTKDRQR